MKNSDYWKLRFEQLEQAQNGQGAAAFAEIERQYKEAQKQIEGQIARWYQRFADNNGITLAEARQYLKGAALKEFKWDVKDYIKYGQDNALMGGWMKELENASAKYHISKLEALKIQTQQSLEVMFSKQLGTVTGAMGDLFKSGYYHTAYELQKGFNIGWDIAELDQSRIEKVLAKPWAVDGKNFSERIWGNKQKLISEVHSELTQNIMLGADPQKAIDSLAKKMKTSKYNAGRLIMTEEAYFSSAAQKDCFEELGVEQFEIVATLDSHTSDICRSLDGKHFPMKDYQPGVTAPPFHVNCVLPDSIIYAPDVEMLTQSDYSGDVIEVRTANGRRFTVTPNHIMLTARGWVRAKNIVQGDKVIYYCGWDKFIAETNPTDYHCIPTIENLFASLIKNGAVIPAAMPTAAEDFKGDTVKNGKVNIIFVNGFLRDKFNSTQRKFFCDSTLIGAKFGDGETVLPGNGTVARFLMCIGLSADGIVSGGRIADIFFRSPLTHHELVRFRKGAHYNTRLFKTAFNGSCGNTKMVRKFLDATSGFIHGDNFINREFPPCVRVANCDSVFVKDSHDWLSADTKDTCNFGDAFAGVVEFDDVVRVEVSFYSGHVYDASSLSTLYYCNGFLSSNCRSTTVPYFDENFGDIGERAARDEETGKTYYVPDDMNYQEWKEAFVDGENKGGLQEVDTCDKIKSTDDEAWAVNEYISSGSYKINAVLREGQKLSVEQEEFVRRLDSALQSAPVYVGTVYRSLSAFGIDDINLFVSSYRPGEIKMFPSYTSASTVVYDESFPIQYIIKSKRGRDFRTYNSGEMEILFLRGTSFRIIRVDAEKHTIYMEEV